MQEEAKLVAPLRQLSPQLKQFSARLANILPHLTLEARRLASGMQAGIHGRRRAGAGDAFWSFRNLDAGEAVARVDWRRSARDDKLYVREKEQENAANYWLFVDFSPSMLFQSSLAIHAKRDRALIVALALADLLVRSGERVGLIGEEAVLMKTTTSRGVMERMAEAWFVFEGGQQRAVLPSPPPFQGTVLLLSDFIAPIEVVEEKLRLFTSRGMRGYLVLIRDPAEELFPFKGEVEFFSPEGGEELQPWRVGQAQGIVAAYRARILEKTEKLRILAQKAGFYLLIHSTGQGAALGLSTLLACIEGEGRGREPKKAWQNKDEGGVKEP